jgi:hypothetical protein
VCGRLPTSTAAAYGASAIVFAPRFVCSAWIELRSSPNATATRLVT